MRYLEDTIAAVSTPPGTGGIGIIRISGPNSFTTADKIFASKTPVSKMISHTIIFGKIIDPSSEEVIDECMLSKMDAPATYTRENVVEINCHGSYATVKKILEIVFSLGVRPADPGEFTKRAFLNGRIDLSEAEAVMDLIAARTDESRKAALHQMEGRLSSKLNEIRAKLISALAEIEVTLDYPEHETHNVVGEHAMNTISEVILQLRNLSETYGRGRLIREGMHIVIAGRPNAGKSSLLNMLCGKNRAIVTAIPGTTRDLIDEYIDIDGIPIILTDTAGIRKTDDEVEKIGVELAVLEVEKADLVIYVIDSTENKTFSLDLINKFRNRKIMVLINKIDKVDGDKLNEIKDLLSKYKPIEISLKTGDGINAVFEGIKSIFSLASTIINSDDIITNVRHKVLLDKSLDALSNAQESYKSGMPLDCISYDIWDGAQKIGEITGDTINDQVIESIFTTFCLGK